MTRPTRKSPPVKFTAKEDELLRRHYPGAGHQPCREHLPRRTDGEIIHRARKLELPGIKGPLSAQGLTDRRKKNRAARIKRLENPERAQRKCLGPCGEMFTSEWAGHRMCPRCRDRIERVGSSFSVGSWA